MTLKCYLARPHDRQAEEIAARAFARALLTCLEPGQFIPVHRPGVDMALIVLEGDGQIVAGDAKEVIHPGAVIFVPAGVARGVKAETRLVALHVVSPPPTEKDHLEVMAKLKQGEWQ